LTQYQAVERSKVKFIEDITADSGQAAVVALKEKHKKPLYLACINIHLVAKDLVKYYAKR
jgi:hypothetical protein